MLQNGSKPAKNGIIKNRFELKSKCIEINLPPEDWPSVEENLINRRDYQIIDDLRLTSVGKCKLWLFTVEHLEEYCFFEDHSLTNKTKIRCLALDILMARNQNQDERKSFSKMMLASEELAVRIISKQSIAPL